MWIKILNKFSKDNFGVARIPLDVNIYMFKNKGESVSQLEV